MVRVIAISDVVRVVAVTGSAAAHMILASAERGPRPGDTGTVVDIAERLGGVGRHYTVSLKSSDGRPIGLAIFVAHELEIVE